METTESNRVQIVAKVFACPTKRMLSFAQDPGVSSGFAGRIK